MPAHDANNATWYVLRYAEDFNPRPGTVPYPESPFEAPSVPYLQQSLLFDERRGVLELCPEPPPFAAAPPPGLAVDIGGDIYRVDERGVLIVVRCDGSAAIVPCAPGILAQPAGLAIDRRGYLYVADPAARRVVVIDPEDGTVRAILGGGGPIGCLVEPIDVAISPGGLVFVADRGAGRVAVFSSGMRPVGSFALVGVPGKEPRPIAVAIDAAGNVLVADAFYPRLLTYAPDGARLADVDLTSLVTPLAGGELARGALDRAYGARVPLFLVGSCGPCATPGEDGPARLAEVHRALRLLALALGRRFTTSGTFISRALDGGRPGVLWHRVEVEFNGTSPPGTSVLVETFTSDSATPTSITWSAPRGAAGYAIPFEPDRPDQLVQSDRGRFLWLRVTLVTADGTATPSVRAIRAFYPRVSWLDLLPTPYRRDPEAAAFTDRFLALFEHVFTRVEDRYEEFSRELNPDAAPREVIDWLAALIDLAFDPSWPLERRRALVAEAMQLYRTRGTIAGLARYVEIYTGIRPQIVEGWLERPSRPAVLGRPGSILGCGLPILGGVLSAAMLPDDELWARHAHRFAIYVYIGRACDTDVIRRAVDRIVEINKPAHTTHRIQAVYPDARLGFQSRVGLDLVLGAAPPPAGVLGVDAVVSPRRPEYVRRFDGTVIE
jgi:phage tail-like protein